MMTAEQLKASILQMAMQGKLVEQREEGTGEELYQKIMEERQQLVKSGRIKRDNVAEESTGEPPFDIPDTWHWATLNDIVSKTIKRGKSPKYVPNSGTLVFAQKCNTKAGYIDLSLCLYLDESKIDKYPEEEFMLDGDIVVNSTGNGTLGRVGVYHDSDNPTQLPIVPDSHVTVIRCNKYMNLGFILYCLRYYQPYMEKLGSGSTNQTELGAGLLKALYFPIPPLEEQKRIVAKIEELMPFVEQYAKASTRLNTLNASFPEQMKKSILQQAVMGKLVPQDPSDEPASMLLKKIAEEKQKLIKEGKIKKQKASNVVVSDDKPFEIPESWAWATLADLAKQITDGEHSTPKRSTKYDGYYLLSARNVRDGSIQLTDVDYVDKAEFDRISSRCNPTRGDILISCSGSVGRCTVVDDDNKYVMVRSAAMVSPVMCNPKYLMYAIQSECVQSQMNGLKKQTAQANLFLGAISVLMIPVPPIEEQNRIVGKLEDTLKHIEGSLKDSIQ